MPPPFGLMSSQRPSRPASRANCRTKGHEARARLQPEAAGRALARNKDRCGTVANLRRVPSGHLALRQERRLQGRERLGGRVAPRRLVDAEDDARVRVGQVDGHDLVVEATLVCRRRGAAMRLEGISVELLARETPFVGDHFGGDSLGHDLPAVEQLVREIAPVRSHRNARHHLYSRGDHEVELSGRDRGCRAEVGLHGRAALTVDRRSAHRFGPAGDEGHHPSQVPALLADLRHAAELDVLDLRRI